MTIKQIETKMTKEVAKFETAKKIREMLDQLEKQVGKDDYDEDEMQDLIFGE